jgi:hypothetical protein
MRRDNPTPEDDVRPLTGEEIAERVRKGEPTPEYQEFLAELEATAQPADMDTEELLNRLQPLQAQRSYYSNGEGNKLYEKLRDEAAERLEETGPRYYVGEDGVKRYAVRQQSHPLEVSVSELIAEYGEDNPELLDRIAPRKVDRDQFKRAVATGKVSAEVLLRVARFKHSKPFVRFVAPGLEDEE